jgi:hypothetical protein
LKKSLHIATSPLTNCIFAGHITKDGCYWREGKQEVTTMALWSVCEHVLASTEPVLLSSGAGKFKITVEKL